jgi:SOS-response transcriptional repressor LexA
MGVSADHVASKSDEVLEYIRWHWKNLGYAPTYRSIGKACDIKSTSTVQGYLNRLRWRGLISIGPKGQIIQPTNNGDVRYCDHDWRVLSLTNPMPIVCSACGHKTEVEYDPPENCDPTDLLKYTGKAQ